MLRKKSVVIEIGQICPASFSISQNSLLPNVICYKYLSLSFDNSLSFDSHVCTICGKCYNIINQLFRIFRTKNVYVLILAKKNYWRPIFPLTNNIVEIF